MNWLLVAMFGAIALPVIAIRRNKDVWQKVLGFASISTKTSVAILLVSVVRNDWTIGVVGVLILSAGNAALMLLAHLLARLNIR